MTLTPQWLDELRARTTLSTLIGRSIKVTRAGREYKACCPFHHEKTPSFTINDEKGFYHCLAGETMVLTADGRRTIADLAGSRARLLSRGGRWIDAPIREYGKQRLWAIRLTRNRQHKTIFATDGHRWFARGVKKEVLTSALRQGHRLESALPPLRQNWTMNADGIRHGILFGDGTSYRGDYGTINLHGDKDAALANWFPDQPHHPRQRANGKSYLRIYGGRAFAGCKQLPALSQDSAYLLGFLAGYLAADGHVAKDGTVMLNSANPDTLDYVRDIATTLGIATYGRTTQHRVGIDGRLSALHRIHLVPGTLHADLFLLPQARQRYSAADKRFARLRWTVQSVEPTDRIETVYCAEVPDEHCFALDDNILTGNCFGCGAHGDAIRWMTDQRGLAFMDAVKELAATAGMDVPAADPRAAQKQEEAKSLRDVTTAAAHWFEDQLGSADGDAARAYLKRRGISDATRRAFGFGFAPDSRTRLKTALRDFPVPMLVEAGMLIAVEDKDPYDRFRGRLMIPIRDARGRVIAFGGRILGDGEPKYLNSPDTPLFDKGRTLYNLDRASPASRQTGRVIVVEGYMDVIALAEAGIADAVAPLGTALTEQQLTMLWRMVPVPVLCFDGDAAGQKAAMRAAVRALPLLQPGHSLAFATLPAGQDPDDVVRSGGAAAMEALLGDPQPLVERLWAHECKAGPLTTPEDRAALKSRLLAHADSIGDADVRHHYREAFRERLDQLFARPRPASARSPDRDQGRPMGRGRFQPDPRLQPPQTETRGIAAGGIASPLVAALLGGLLRYPEALVRNQDALARLSIADRDDAGLLDAMLDAAISHQGLDSTALLAILATSKLYNRALTLVRADAMRFSFHRRDEDEDGTVRTKALHDLDEFVAVLVTQPEIRAQLASATARFAATLDEAGLAEQARLRALDAELTRRLADLSDSGDQNR